MPRNSDRRQRIEKLLSDSQWRTSAEIADIVGGKRITVQTALANMKRVGILESRKSQKRGNTRVGRCANEYRKVPSNLFNPDEFYDHYRDTVGDGMSLKRHPNHAHL